MCRKARGVSIESIESERVNDALRARGFNFLRFAKVPRPRSTQAPKFRWLFKHWKIIQARPSEAESDLQTASLPAPLFVALKILKNERVRGYSHVTACFRDFAFREARLPEGLIVFINFVYLRAHLHRHSSLIVRNDGCTKQASDNLHCRLGIDHGRVP